MVLKPDRILSGIAGIIGLVVEVQPVGWVERSDTHHVIQQGDGFRKCSTHPTRYRAMERYVTVAARADGFALSAVSTYSARD